MKLNDITCLNYEVGTDKAVVMLATTDLDAIKAIPEAAELMIYDGIENPLFSLCGFDRIVSIRLFIEDNASEVVLAKTDSTLLDMKSRLNALEESAPAAQSAADLSSLVFVCLAQDATIDSLIWCTSSSPRAALSRANPYHNCPSKLIPDCRCGGSIRISGAIC